jgi:hypothetical protein
MMRTALILTLSLAASPAAARTCTVEATEGSGIWHVVGGAWAPLAAGTAVSLRERVRTGADSRLRILCDDGIEVTVGADSEVALGSLAAGDGASERVSIKTLRGVTGVAAPAGSVRGLAVRSDLATASVRGTEWLVQVARGDKTTDVFVRDGVVSVTSRAGTVALEAGEGITVAPAGPEAKKAWGAPRIAAVGARLGFGWK